MRRFVVVLALSLFSPLLAGCPVESKPEVRGSTLSYGSFSDVKNAGATVIDVRSKDEYVSEHISGAQSIEFNAQNFATATANFPRNGSYLVYDRTGKTSKFALQEMTRLGFSNIHDLDGGIVAWKLAGYPVVTGTDPGPVSAPSTRGVNQPVPPDQNHPADATQPATATDPRFPDTGK